MRELYWVGSSREDLRAFPEEVRLAFGYGLYLAQQGDKHPGAKPLRGFTGASVMEIIERFDTNAFRAVYVVNLQSGVYVLHAFQKKSTQGIATSRRDIDLIRQRLQQAIRYDAELRRRE
ncbi:type II toxin-antitoxin system RelE/ParE family toxin [soil metagenome]